MTIDHVISRPLIPVKKIMIFDQRIHSGWVGGWAKIDILKLTGMTSDDKTQLNIGDNKNKKHKE